MIQPAPSTPITDPVQLFAATVLREGVDEPTLACLRQLGQSHQVNRGCAAPLKESEDQLVFVAEGATKLVAHVAVGREQILAFHFARDLVWVPARLMCAFSLCAVADSDMVAFPAHRLLDYARDRAAMLGVLLERSMQALHGSRSEAITLGRKSAQERVASFLLAIADRIGSPEGSSALLELPMSRRDIADSLGLTIETVSRQLSELRLLGLIETSGRSFVRLRNLDGLRECAGQVPLAA